MIEIPESRTLAKQMKEQLAGRTIVTAEANRSPHGFAFYIGDPKEYGVFLAGSRIEDVQAVAGYVELFLSGKKRLAFFDGTNLRYVPPGGKLPEKHQLLLTLDDGSFVYCTVQMYGGIFAFPEGGIDDNIYYTVAHEKVNPLEDGFDRAYFDSLFVGLKPTMSVKAALATEQRIPGLGNGVLQDILFNARVHPKTKLSALTKEDYDRLFTSLKETLAAMTEQGGRDTEKDFYGNPGGYHSILSSKTWKEPCPVCYGAIVRKAFLGGNVYYCPNCQPEKK